MFSRGYWYASVGRPNWIGLKSLMIWVQVLSKTGRRMRHCQRRACRKGRIVFLQRKIFGWLVRRPSDCGELSCLRNCNLYIPLFTHSFFWASAKPIVKNRNNTGAILSPCFTLTLNGIVLSTLPIINQTMLFWYILSIADCRFGGNPHLSSTLMTRTWLDLLNAFTRLSNRTHVGKLWTWRKCNNFLIVKLPSWHTTPDGDPNWYSN